MKAFFWHLQGRWRALGNIQFVGQLYKKRMLTEKIMHECIKGLLEDVSHPSDILSPPSDTTHTIAKDLM